MANIHVHFHDAPKHDPKTGQFTSGSGGMTPAERKAGMTGKLLPHDPTEPQGRIFGKSKGKPEDEEAVKHYGQLSHHHQELWKAYRRRHKAEPDKGYGEKAEEHRKLAHQHRKNQIQAENRVSQHIWSQPSTWRRVRE